MPRAPWLQQLLVDAPASCKLDAASAVFDEQYHGSHAFLLARVVPGDLWKGPLTPWTNNGDWLQWQLHGCQQDAYTLKVVELIRVEPPILVKSLTKRYATVPFLNSLQVNLQHHQFREARPNGVDGPVLPEATVQHMLGQALQRLVCVPLAGPVHHLIAQRWCHNILCRVAWIVSRASSKVWKDLAVDMEWPPDAWLQRFRGPRLPSCPVKPKLLTEKPCCSIANLIRQHADKIIDAAADEAEAEDLTLQLEQAAQQLDAHTASFAVQADRSARAYGNHQQGFKHSSLMLIHSVSATLHLRNRRDLRTVFEHVIKAIYRIICLIVALRGLSVSRFPDTRYTSEPRLCSQTAYALCNVTLRT